jgi:hypothetical protein
MDGNKEEQGFIIDSEINRAVLRQFLSSLPNGLTFHKIILDQNGKPIDYVFLEVN